MRNNLLSIDWDYFINVHTQSTNSYRETQRDILGKWYNEYFMEIERGRRLEKEYTLGSIYKPFMKQVLPKLKIEEKAPFTLSESHVVAYEVALREECDAIYLLDAHSDLGYGGLEALNYEVNCANWLGMLFKENKIKEAYIVYSPYTKEYRWEFEEFILNYPIHFISLEELLVKNISFKTVHMCRSGPWTPPWYDQQFYDLAYELIDRFHLKCQDEVGGKRRWRPRHLSLAEKINYQLGVV